FRTAWARQAAPLRRHAFTPLARRSVTTDAASSHAENVPQEDDKPFTVQLSDESFETYEIDPPPYTLEVTKKELKQMYHDMVSTRYALLLEHLFFGIWPNIPNSSPTSGRIRRQ
ncbi:hypothetical protein AFLA_000070, partial [Aspergillus flavus NRRL3357]